MKRLTAYICLGLCLTQGGCSSSPDIVLDSFEGPLTAETVDCGAGGGATLQATAATDTKVDGDQSLRLDYDISSGGFLWAARGVKLNVPGAAAWAVQPQQIHWTKFRGFSVQMFGTNSGGNVAFDVKDNGAEMWRFILVDSFTGWRQIDIPFEEFFPRSDWQPPDAEQNKKIDFPLLSFQFEPRTPETGTYYFDRVALVKQ